MLCTTLLCLQLLTIENTSSEGDERADKSRSSMEFRNLNFEKAQSLLVDLITLNDRSGFIEHKAELLSAIEKGSKEQKSSLGLEAIFIAQNATNTGFSTANAPKDESAIERLKWDFAQFELIRFQNERAQSKITSDLVAPPKNFNPQFWHVLLIWLGIILLFYTTRQKTKSSRFIQDEGDFYFNEDFTIIEQSLRNRTATQSAVVHLALLELELDSYAELVQENHREAWQKLSSSQRKIAHLIYRKVDNDSITSNLGISEGHFYNERSAIRRTLGLQRSKSMSEGLADLYR